MDWSAINPAFFIASIMVSATPLLLAAIGELVAEKTGVLNLGVEGMMITGAICGFIISVETGSPTLGFICGALGGAVLSLIFALLTQLFMANQVASGLALTLFGLGFSSMIGQGYVGIVPPDVPKLMEGADLSAFQRIALGHDAVLYIGLLIPVIVWYVLKYTRLGLVLRAVGEDHEAAHALGYKVIWIRVGAIFFGGACAGLGGAYLSLVRVPQWTDGMTAGIGWIALALVVFASWRPLFIIIGAYLFGGVTVLQLNLQAAGSTIPVEYLSMSPYVITILVLVLLSVLQKYGLLRAAAPAMLGRLFHASN
ncbi:ABC transporter permease [Nereida sp. MMG025]|uniref:ABC transporter permease n=1 Tax=Nereida sp. MMG025 TaxID=2909981 RepID=UPI001F3D6897|nr:ABC transporter permease [Nereida sp. MMG025]MCF6444142.1 ABC transporter permease [Nereida sp. MMG025]